MLDTIDPSAARGDDPIPVIRSSMPPVIVGLFIIAFITLIFVFDAIGRRGAHLFEVRV